ncbi:hypothetical protein D3C71_1308000 [compost metagenome]
MFGVSSPMVASHDCPGAARLIAWAASSASSIWTLVASPISTFFSAPVTGSTWVLEGRNDMLAILPSSQVPWPGPPMITSNTFGLAVLPAAPSKFALTGSSATEKLPVPPSVPEPPETVQVASLTTPVKVMVPPVVEAALAEEANARAAAAADAIVKYFICNLPINSWVVSARADALIERGRARTMNTGV